MSEAAVLLLVDLQQATFGGCGIPPAHQADVLLQKTEALLQEARASGVPVVHVQHCADAGEAFAEGAPGWPIAPRLSPVGREPLVQKRARNAFEGTNLRAVLQGLGASSLVVATPRWTKRSGFAIGSQSSTMARSSRSALPAN